MSIIQPERLKITNLLIKDILDKDFYNELSANNLNLVPISLVFLRVQKKELIDGKPEFNITSLNLAHENENELREKILHVACQDPELLEKMSKLLGDLAQNANE